MAGTADRDGRTRSSGTLRFSADDYRALRLFVEAAGRDRPAVVRLAPAGGPGRDGRTVPLAQGRRFAHLVLPVVQGRDYVLSWSEACLALIYLSDGDDMLDEGIRVLPVPGTSVASGHEHGRVHFGPLSGQMTRACGPVRFQGRWHVFYRFRPYGPSRGPYCWGHAASLDLVHWTDLPVFLFPKRQEGGDETPSDTSAVRTGSVSAAGTSVTRPEDGMDAPSDGEPLSCCAVPVDADGHPCAGDDAAALKIYLTRRRARRDGPSVCQATLLCQDGLTAGPETRLPAGPGPSSAQDPHDPKVDIPADDPAMMVAATTMPSSSLPLEHQPGRSDVPDAVRADGRHGWYATGPHSVPGEDVPGEDMPQWEGAEGRPAIASAVNPDPDLGDDGWVPTGAVLMENGLGPAGTYDCPDLFGLDGRSVAMAGLTRYRDGLGGRFRPIRWYVGDLRRNQRVNGVRAPRFLVRMAGWLDFGPSLAAVQTCVNEGRRIMLGCVADLAGPHDSPAGAAGGVLTLPRQLHVRGDRLWQHPATEVYAHVLGDILTQMNVPDLPDSPERRRIRLDIPGNAYYADIRLVDSDKYDDVDLLLSGWGDDDGERAGDADLSGSLSEDLGVRPDHWLSLSDCDQGFEDGLTRFVTHGFQRLASVDPVSDIGRGSLNRIEVFYDRGIAEVFLNDGQAAGTIAVPDPRAGRGCFEAVLPKGALLTLRTLRGRDRD